MKNSGKIGMGGKTMNNEIEQEIFHAQILKSLYYQVM